MSAPIINQDQFIAALRATMDKKWNVPFYLEFPKDPDVVRYGIYVSEVTTASRVPYALAVNTGGNIYYAVDQVKVVYVSFQDDPYVIPVNGKISEMVTNLIMDGYHERNHTTELVYGDNLEKHSWTFQLTRLEFQ